MFSIGPKIRGKNQSGVTLIKKIRFRASVFVRNMDTDQPKGRQVMADCDFVWERGLECADEDLYEMSGAKTKGSWEGFPT